MATVKGDVHDIGKNIVGVVLQCNNYDVIDLGVMVPAAKILETAKTERADIIGLSGLITPSLDEMCHVAAEMERQGFDVPLLIGGATTSRVHTAVKIHPNYRRGQTVYVNDASRAVGVASSLMSRENRGPYVADIRSEYARIAAAHARAEENKQRLSLDAAREKCAQARLVRRCCAAAPSFLGTRVLADFAIAELVPFIDWTPFFQTWELAGKFPAILDDAKVGAAARSLFDDAQAMLARIAKERWFRARAVVGFWPANSDGDDIAIFADEARGAPLAVLHTLRQQLVRREGRTNVALADFVAPRERLRDYIGAFTVTAGIGEDEIAERFKLANDDYSSILVKALADRLAEAFAERLHQRVRKEFWGYAADETLGNRGTDRRKISRHPPGARLSGAARPHREGDAVRAARRRAADRRAADGELRHVAGRIGLRALFQPSRQPLFRRRQDRARSGRGLRAAQGLDDGRSREVAGADPQLRSAGDRPHRGGVTANKNENTGADAAPVSLNFGRRLDATALEGFWRLDSRTQNAPSKIAPTKKNTAHTARTLSFKVTSTRHASIHHCTGDRLAEAWPAPKRFPCCIAEGVRCKTAIWSGFC